MSSTVKHDFRILSSAPVRSTSRLFAKGTDSDENYGSKQMVGYNDDAFGLIFLTGGVLSQDVDFIGTFLAFSAMAAIYANSTDDKNDTRLPGLVAMVTLVVTPIVAFVHNGILAAPQPIEIGLCLVSLVWSWVKWSQEQNE